MVTLARALAAGLLGSLLATQLYAWLVGYALVLGRPLLFDDGHWRVYAPWQLYGWAWQWGTVQPQPFVWPGLLILATMGLLVLGGARIDAKTARSESVGWQTKRGLRAAGLLAPHGVVIGKWRRQRR